MANKVGIAVGGEYGAFCNTNGSLSGNTFQSTSGTLTLTATGASFSGTFTFNAVNLKDKTKTIQVSGSFSNVVAP